MINSKVFNKDYDIFIDVIDYDLDYEEFHFIVDEETFILSLTMLNGYELMTSDNSMIEHDSDYELIDQEELHQLHQNLKATSFYRKVKQRAVELVIKADSGMAEIDWNEQELFETELILDDLQ
ncbi:hypothetical protein CU052_16925 [Vibrio harveyi]|uniref:hypothetical protein n=1 Tax=Vibrio harveyi group TaxID=717610 RepID=UPI0005F08A27|nr:MULTISPECIES: hypothetical protein [Vibrio harveyi group]AWB00875.1 hypothetical protein CU052_16925 [Vibrio harveyi]